MSKWVVTIECDKCWKRHYDCFCPSSEKENPELLNEYDNDKTYFERLTTALETAPMTFLPSLLVTVLKSSWDKKVFVDREKMLEFCRKTVARFP